MISALVAHAKYLRSILNTHVFEIDLFLFLTS